MKKICFAKKNLKNKASFTVEASILFAVIFISILLVFKMYLFQFVFHYSRAKDDLFVEEYTKMNKGWNLEKLVIEDYKHSRCIDFEDFQNRECVTYDRRIDYLKTFHCYTMIDEFGEEAWNVFKGDKE